MLRPRVSSRQLCAVPRLLWQLRSVLGSGTGPRILFQRHAGIGDIICTFPAVLALRKKHPGCRLVYRVEDRFADVVRLARVAEVVLPMPPGGDWKLPRLCENRFDFVFRPRLESERAEGYARGAHLVDDFCASLAVQPESRQPRIHVPDDLRKEVDRQLEVGQRDGPLLGIHTGPTWPAKEWTDESWATLLRLLGPARARVLQLGADANTGKGFAKAGRIPGAEDWIGRLSLRESVACIARCDLLIGVDSGLLHIAGAVGTPVLGLFGPTSPQLCLPPETTTLGVTADVPCLGCEHRSPVLHWREGCPHEIRCMRDISPEQVALAARALLRRGKKHG